MLNFTNIDACDWVITILCIDEAVQLIATHWNSMKERGIVNVCVVGEIALDLNFLKVNGFNYVVRTTQKIETYGETLPTPHVVEAWVALLEQLPTRAKILLISARWLAISLTSVALLKSKHPKEHVEIMLDSILGSEFNYTHRQVLTALTIEFEGSKPPPSRSCCLTF